MVAFQETTSSFNDTHPSFRQALPQHFCEATNTQRLPSKASSTIPFPINNERSEAKPAPVYHSAPTSDVVLKTAHTTIISKAKPTSSPSSLSSTHDSTSTPNVVHQEVFEATPIWVAFTTYVSYVILFLFGLLRDAMRKYHFEEARTATEHPSLKSIQKIIKSHCTLSCRDFPPLYRGFESFFSRNMYRRIRDCFNRPICSTPGATVSLAERVTEDFGWTFRPTGEARSYINLGSYNYLGFAECTGPCAEAAISAINTFGVSACTSRVELGTSSLHTQLENQIASFVGKEDAIVFGMGFATNAANIPVIASKGCLLVSDELNHASLVLGARLSGATISVFRHNDMDHLEDILRNAIIKGHPRTCRPWRKIIIVVEGVYSMEGSLVNLPRVIELKRKYKAYLYLDEAHSIGALGVTGRGVVEHFGCDSRDVDIMMGTFTKSFGAAGGYIASSKDIIRSLRVASHSHIYATAMSPPIAQQIVSSLHAISTAGLSRIQTLAFNAVYFRQCAQQMGFVVYGNDASPVIPVLVYHPAKTATLTKSSRNSSALSRMMKARGVAIVVVGYPATPIVESRVRFCISASHTQEQLQYTLRCLDECGEKLGLKYSQIYSPKSFDDVHEIASRIATASLNRFRV
eukprot:gene2175-5196_t